MTSAYIFLLSSQECETVNLNFDANTSPSETERIKADDANVIYRAVRSNNFITSLSLQYQNIGDAGAKFISLLLEVSVLNC